MKTTVMCFYCGAQIDKTADTTMKVNATKYCHKKCDEVKLTNPKFKVIWDKEQIYQYMKTLEATDDINYSLMMRQIDNYMKTYDCSGEVILNTLKYFYNMNIDSIDKSNGGIGIFPYAYDDYKKYAAKLEQVKELNKSKRLSNSDEEVIIPVPEVKRKSTKFCSLLDD